jgi:cell division protein FtsB
VSDAFVVALGEWATEEEKTIQLAAYARELRLAHITHELVVHGLSRTSLKQSVSECQERVERETDPARKASLEKECESLRNREIALGDVVRDLKEEREKLTRR